ncbi:MAG: thiamine-phosphate kinase [Proteobacteria bacterium]|nr:thiamine-phosphate kinase [Pseudomonadota bacterium]MDA1299446.1 thiamine-phosphate kinase [Pseudomonadota bacterium]
MEKGEKGEFELIGRFFSGIGHSDQRVVLGPGDDCGLLNVPEGHELCVSTDTLLSEVHFPADSPGDLVAHRAMAANLSDLSAMGAAPLGFLVALTLPGSDDQWLQAFATTIDAISREQEIALVGGNMARGTLSVTITVMGVVPSGQGLLRRGASIHEGIFVTGHPGDAAAGLQVLRAGITGYDDLKAAYIRPPSRLGLGQQLRPLASACIDVSDGLLADLDHLLQASGVGAEIMLPSLPLSESLVAFSGPDASRLALAGGDDYELCFSAPMDHESRLLALAAEAGINIALIGRIVTGSGIRLIDAAGQSTEADVSGYSHF